MRERVNAADIEKMREFVKRYKTLGNISSRYQRQKQQIKALDLSAFTNSEIQRAEYHRDTLMYIQQLQKSLEEQTARYKMGFRSAFKKSAVSLLMVPITIIRTVWNIVLGLIK